MHPPVAAARPPINAFAAVDTRTQPPDPYLPDLMTKMGVYLRSRKLAPEAGLKRFIQAHGAGRVVVLDS